MPKSRWSPKRWNRCPKNIPSIRFTGVNYGTHASGREPLWHRHGADPRVLVVGRAAQGWRRMIVHLALPHRATGPGFIYYLFARTDPEQRGPSGCPGKRGPATLSGFDRFFQHTSPYFNLCTRRKPLRHSCRRDTVNTTFPSQLCVLSDHACFILVLRMCIGKKRFLRHAHSEVDRGFSSASRSCNASHPFPTA